jgi:hypothetical protein
MRYKYGNTNKVEEEKATEEVAEVKPQKKERGLFVPLPRLRAVSDIQTDVPPRGLLPPEE